MNAHSARAATVSALVTIAVLVAAGCASPAKKPPLESSDGTSAVETTSAAPAFAHGAELEPEGAIDVADLTPALGTVSYTVELEEGTTRGRIVTEASGTRLTSVTTLQHDGTEELIETSVLTRETDGSLGLVSVDSHPDRAVSLFRTPLLIAPPSLEATKEAHSSVEMRVVDEGNRKVQKDRGTGTRTIRYDRDEEITLHGSVRRAKVATVEFVADLWGAKAERTSTLYVIPGEGVVVEEWEESIHVLAIITKKHHQTWIRDEAAKAAAK